MLRRHWPLVATLVVQLAIVAAVPARKVRAHLEGTRITLRTEPVDPYDLLSGYYVTLGYEAERVVAPEDLRPAPGETCYVLLRRGEPAWNALQMVSSPLEPSEDEVTVRATWNGHRAVLDGASRFYIPETRRQEIEQAMRDVNGRALVDMKVGPDGSVALLRLRIGDKVYEK